MVSLLIPKDKDLPKLFKTTDELLKPETSLIQGVIPKWLCGGSFIRVGPGKFDFEDFTLNHWLDGYAVLSKFEIGDGVVHFTKRFLQSDSFKRAMVAQRPVVTEFGTKAFPEKGKGILARFVSAIMPEMTDNDVCNIFRLGNDFYVSNDSCYFREINPKNLETGEKYDSNKLFGLNGLSAHPLTDSQGDTYNIGFSTLTGLKYSVIKIPNLKANAPEAFKSAKVLCTISSSYTAGISYVHSFGMAGDRFIIFIEQPYVASVSAIAVALIKGYSVKDWLSWRHEEKNRFHIIDKKTGKVHKIEYLSNEPFFFLHFVNSYYLEESEQIVVDLIAMDNPEMLNAMYLSKLRNSIIENVAQPSCRRFVIPLHKPETVELGHDSINSVKFAAKAVFVTKNKVTLTPEILTEPGCEMPVINSNFTGIEHSYFYASGTIATNAFSNTISKIDVKNRNIISWKGSEYLYPGEPLFIQNPQSSNGEDDGIIIASVSNVQKGQDDMIVFIDARTMLEIARAKFKEHIPGALHGLFVQNETFSSNTTKIII